jgi:hypothetical protein
LSKPVFDHTLPVVDAIMKVADGTLLLDGLFDLALKEFNISTKELMGLMLNSKYEFERFEGGWEIVVSK